MSKKYNELFSTLWALLWVALIALALINWTGRQWTGEVLQRMTHGAADMLAVVGWHSWPSQMVAAMEASSPTDHAIGWWFAFTLGTWVLVTLLVGCSLFYLLRLLERNSTPTAPTTPAAPAAAAATTTAATGGGTVINHIYPAASHPLAKVITGLMIGGFILILLVMARFWVPDLIEQGVHGNDTHNTAQQMQADASIATIELCGDSNYIPEDGDYASACFGAWLSAREHPEQKAAASAMEGRLAAACSIYALQGDSDQQKLAVEMARNGLPCPASVVQQAQQLTATNSQVQVPAAPTTATSGKPMAEKLALWLAFMLTVVAAGAAITVGLRRWAGGALWPVNWVMATTFVAVTMGVLLFGLAIVSAVA